MTLFFSIYILLIALCFFFLHSIRFQSMLSMSVRSNIFFSHFIYFDFGYLKKFKNNILVCIGVCVGVCIFVSVSLCFQNQNRISFCFDKDFKMTSINFCFCYCCCSTRNQTVKQTEYLWDIFCNHKRLMYFCVHVVLFKSITEVF